MYHFESWFGGNSDTLGFRVATQDFEYGFCRKQAGEDFQKKFSLFIKVEKNLLVKN
jgi:hypothetical protein